MLQIIAGKFKGKKLANFDDNFAIRPTKSITKEAIFNVLNSKIFAKILPKIEEIKILDVFAGTGSLGIEAISRGALFVDFIENNQKHNSLIAKNLALIKHKAEVKIYDQDVSNLNYSKNEYDLIFLDPPYKANILNIAIANLIKKNWLAKNAILICECLPKQQVQIETDFSIIYEKSFGKSKIIVMLVKI